MNAPPPIPKRSSPHARKPNIVFAASGIIAALVVSALFVSFTNYRNSPQVQALEERVELSILAKREVIEHVKSPSTARFGDVRDFQLAETPDGSVARCVTLRSWVDAQNGLGAITRNYWRLKFKKDDTGWHSEGNPIFE